MTKSNLEEAVPKLFCLHFDECDRKKCTALKLARLNLVKIISTIKGRNLKSIVLWTSWIESAFEPACGKFDKVVHVNLAIGFTLRPTDIDH